MVDAMLGYFLSGRLPWLRGRAPRRTLLFLILGHLDDLPLASLGVFGVALLIERIDVLSIGRDVLMGLSSSISATTVTNGGSLRSYGGSAVRTYFPCR